MRALLHFHLSSWFYILGSLCFIAGTVCKELIK